jgi:starch synthase
MTILLASSELHPYSKTGGLADMVGALAKYLARAGQRVGVVTPLYAGIQKKFPDLLATEMRISLPLGAGTGQADVWTLEPERNLTVYFIDHPGFFQRAGLYGERGADYPDNAERFFFFSKCVVHLARSLQWRPEIVHVHDWQVGLVPLLVRHEKAAGGWKEAPKTCLTIHNQAYQGNFPAPQYALTNLPWDYFHPRGAEFYGGLNCLKAGIVFADMITTVSPRYAREITTEALGHGLDGVLRERQNSLIGILNGVDYDEWKTTQNPFLNHSYSADDLSGKAAVKQELQAELGLPQTSHPPLFGTVTRLVEQKGVDIQLSALEEMLAVDLQFVLLGSGHPEFQKAFQRLAVRYPGKVAVKIGYDHRLSHQIEAACDFYLMPSQFEPCGLNQMYSLRYGTIPIVRATGGLDDSIIDLTENTERANGIKFYDYSSRALAKAIRKALVLYENTEMLGFFRHNAMEADFSWERTSLEYLKVFARLLTSG